MRDFNDYLEKNQALTLSEMENIYNRMALGVNSSKNPMVRKLFSELLEQSISYLNIRSKWSSYSNDEKADKDKIRTATHDAVIIRLNMLSRILDLENNDNWRSILGDPDKDPYARKKIGDFACFIAFVEGLNNR